MVWDPWSIAAALTALLAALTCAVWWAMAGPSPAKPSPPEKPCAATALFYAVEADDAQVPS